MSHTSRLSGSAPSGNTSEILHTAKLADDVSQLMTGDVVHCFL
ncbi:Uncharacterized protein dnm_023530 [Desulfonema magnum]|uniref:Uncharacterized protein n=1 Tax=Desulfonema magnum TaxID=45655 RepID=A0A975BJ82_9BACT|nr:Uncharacterized protein dnm_023530 [Desulfonema magnum]